MLLFITVVEDEIVFNGKFFEKPKDSLGLRVLPIALIMVHDKVERKLTNV